MDQFATGLTGTRTPYGACASVVDPRYVSGGSSSGSAVVVADGTVPFALGSDTAGSGRVPAAFDGIVGFKPTLGQISRRGLLPACRSLDCVSLLTTDVLGAARSAELGTYTNFVNLLGLSAVAVPASLRADGLPFGVSLIAPAGADGTLLRLAARWREEHGGAAPGDGPASTVALAVVGAHLSGEPLNGQLVALGARLLETARTAPTYRLYALPTEPAKPGLVGGGPDAGRGIEVEIWELADGGLRPACRGRFAAADDRHDRARRRSHGEGLPVRGERRRRRTRHHGARRLARVPGSAPSRDDFLNDPGGHPMIATCHRPGTAAARSRFSQDCRSPGCSQRSTSRSARRSSSSDSSCSRRSSSRCSATRATSRSSAPSRSPPS